MFLTSVKHRLFFTGFVVVAILHFAHPVFAAGEKGEMSKDENLNVVEVVLETIQNTAQEVEKKVDKKDDKVPAVTISPVVSVSISPSVSPQVTTSVPPLISPTISIKPTITVTPSTVPTISVKPSVTTKPSVTPVPSGSVIPSVTTQPTETAQPSSAPQLTAIPEQTGTGGYVVSTAQPPTPAPKPVGSVLGKSMNVILKPDEPQPLEQLQKLVAPVKKKVIEYPSFLSPDEVSTQLYPKQPLSDTEQVQMGLLALGELGGGFLLTRRQFLLDLLKRIW